MGLRSHEDGPAGIIVINGSLPVRSAGDSELPWPRRRPAGGVPESQAETYSIVEYRIFRPGWDGRPRTSALALLVTAAGPGPGRGSTAVLRALFKFNSNNVIERIFLRKDYTTVCKPRYMPD